MFKFNVVRFYFNQSARILKRNLTIEEAQAHCRDPETSSRTCTKRAGKLRTKRLGPWFDSYCLVKEVKYI